MITSSARSSDSALLTIVRVYKLYLLTYLLTYYRWMDAVEFNAPLDTV